MAALPAKLRVMPSAFLTLLHVGRATAVFFRLLAARCSRWDGAFVLCFLTLFFILSPLALSWTADVSQPRMHDLITHTQGCWREIYWRKIMESEAEWACGSPAGHMALQQGTEG